MTLPFSGGRWSGRRPRRAVGRRAPRDRRRTDASPCGGSGSGRGRRGRAASRRRRAGASRRRPRLTANATLRGAAAAVASTREQLGQVVGARRAAPAGAGRATGSSALRAQQHAPVERGTSSVSAPAASLVAPARRAEQRASSATTASTSARSTRAAPLPALNATTYSRRAAASIRLTTSDAARRVPARSSRPVESAGCASRSAAERAQVLARSDATRASNDEPVPIGGEPTRSSVRHSATCVGKRSWRACLVAAAADDPDLVAVVDDRRAAQQVHAACAPSWTRRSSSAPRLAAGRDP